MEFVIHWLGIASLGLMGLDWSGGGGGGKQKEILGSRDIGKKEWIDVISS